jgi:hypothetical protein
LFQTVFAAAGDENPPVSGVAAPGSPTVVWQEKIVVATGGGYRGPWRMNDSDFRYVDDPSVAITEDGLVGVVWVDQARKDIFFQVFGPDGRPRLTRPVNVSQSPQVFSWLPRLAMAPGAAGEIYVLWQEIVFSGGSHGGETFFARSTDGGRSFGAPVNLSNTPAGDGKGRLTRQYWHNGSLDLVLGPDGSLYAAWTEFEGALWVSRSTDRGARFSPPVQVAGRGLGAPARGPSLAVDAAGVVYLAWAVGEDRAADIHLAISTDQGRSFSRPRPVFATDGHADAPKIAVDRDGTLHLVYAISPAGPFQRYQIHYRRSTDRGRTFEPPRRISGPPTEHQASAHFPTLALDAGGRVYVMWEMFVGRFPHPRGLGFTTSLDGGRSFARASVIPGSIDPGGGVNGSLQGLLMRKLAVSRVGTIAIVNSTFWPGQRSEVWLLRGQAGGR